MTREEKQEQISIIDERLYNSDAYRKYLRDVYFYYTKGKTKK